MIADLLIFGVCSKEESIYDIVNSTESQQTKEGM